MKIASVRSASLALTALAVLAVSAAAQQPDFSKVEIKTTKITNNFHALEGQGGRIGVLSGPDGVLMVDGQFAPLTEKIVAAIKQISPSRSASSSTRTSTATTPAAMRTSPSWASSFTRARNCAIAWPTRGRTPRATRLGPLRRWRCRRSPTTSALHGT
jgi:hypothetical protein